MGAGCTPCPLLVCTLGPKHPSWPPIYSLHNLLPPQAEPPEPPALLRVLRAGCCFLGWFQVLLVVFSVLLPLPWAFVCASHIGFGTVGKFLPGDGIIQGGCRQHGVGTTFGYPSCPAAATHLRGLFAKGQRNYRTAEIPAHPKGAQQRPGVMQVPEREPRGLADPHQPIFYPKSPFLLGQRPRGFWRTDPGTAGPGGCFPLAPASAKAWGQRHRRHLGCTGSACGNGNLSPHDPTWRGKYLSDGS